MAYIDKAFYLSMSGVAITDSEFSPMAERASDIIDALTFRAVERFGLAEGNPLFAMVKKAVAYQMEFIQQTYGSLEMWATEGAVPDGAETIGNYSYSKGSKSNAGAGIKSINGLAVSPLVDGILAPVVALGRRIG